LPKNAFPALDISVFTPDGKSVIFAAAGDGPGAQGSWTDEFVGYHLSPSRHSIPEDLWRVSLAEHRLTRLTHLGTFGYNPSFSPDGKHIAFSSVNGIYVMRSDGSELAQIYAQGVTGTLQWVP
jgi:Tol biopolymer transport system component